MSRHLATLLALLLSCNTGMALTVAEVTDANTKVDVPPVPMQTPPPKYPAALRDAGVSGLVVITVVIDETGAVLASEVKKSSQPEFELPALEAMANWKFKPAMIADKAVKVRVAIPIRFNAAPVVKPPTEPPA